KKEKKIDWISKQVPVIKHVPREERLQVLNKALKNPAIWITFIGLMELWLFLFADTILSWGEIDYGIGSIKWFGAIFKQMFFPVLVPAMVIMGVLLLLRNYLIKRIVRKEYLNE